MSRPGSLRLIAGMVGGGPGSDIGRTHRYAMRLDDRYALVAGVFAREAARSSATAAEVGVADDRRYDDFRTMAAHEAEREDGIDLAVVATPNDSHFDIAKSFIEAGISVVCEKPLTRDSASSAELVRLAEEHGVVLAVPHCYSAYAMVRHAARLVREGALGRLTYVDVEHASGWAATALERTGHKQAAWRTDPDVAGFPSVVGDLGTHAYHLARYVTGLDAEQVSAQLHTLVPGRQVFDNATVALRLTGPAGPVPGRLWASMAATGHNHGLRIRVFGDEASLEWRHEDPHHLRIAHVDGRATVLAQGLGDLSHDATRLTRVGLGHPEGFIEAFANFYRDLADDLRALRDGDAVSTRDLSYPTGVDGLLGVRFVEAVAASHERDGAWTTPEDNHEQRI